MKILHKNELETLYSTTEWKECIQNIETYLIQEHCGSYMNSTATIIPTGMPSNLQAQYLHCMLYYSQEPYTIYTATYSTCTKVRPYIHEDDSVLLSAQSVVEHCVPPNMFCCIPTKTPYSMIAIQEIPAMRIAIPQYCLRPLTNTVTVQCFSLIQKYAPHNQEAYPVELGWTLADLIDSLGIEQDIVRIVFVNNTATLKSTPVIAGSTITLFPGIGGG